MSLRYCLNGGNASLQISPLQPSTCGLSPTPTVSSHSHVKTEPHVPHESSIWTSLPDCQPEDQAKFRSLTITHSPPGTLTFDENGRDTVHFGGPFMLPHDARCDNLQQVVWNF